MTTIVVNERTKAGKIVLDLAKILATTNKGVTFDVEKNVKAVEYKSQELSVKQEKWMNGLKKVAIEVKSGTFKGNPIQNLMNEL